MKLLDKTLPQIVELINTQFKGQEVDLSGWARSRYYKSGIDASLLTRHIVYEFIEKEFTKLDNNTYGKDFQSEDGVFISYSGYSQLSKRSNAKTFAIRFQTQNPYNSLGLEATISTTKLQWNTDKVTIKGFTFKGTPSSIQEDETIGDYITRVNDQERNYEISRHQKNLKQAKTNLDDYTLRYYDSFDNVNSIDTEGHDYIRSIRRRENTLSVTEAWKYLQTKAIERKEAVDKVEYYRKQILYYVSCYNEAVEKLVELGEEAPDPTVSPV